MFNFFLEKLLLKSEQQLPVLSKHQVAHLVLKGKSITLLENKFMS